MKCTFFLLLVNSFIIAYAQPAAYSVSNLHSHNDYEKPSPFWGAYNQGYGSIEADIFLFQGKLIVAHDTVQRRLGRTLDSLYLDPLQACIKKNNGYPYANHSQPLQLLIDIKTDSTKTLDALIDKLSHYPLLTTNPKLKIVITGNRPATDAFGSYPAFILFDGELHVEYPASALAHIEMLSDNFHSFSLSNAIDSMPPIEKKRITDLINRGHALHKKVRFWNAPDNPNNWKAFTVLGVDYINTDRTEAAATFIRQSALH